MERLRCAYAFRFRQILSFTLALLCIFIICYQIFPNESLKRFLPSAFPNTRQLLEAKQKPTTLKAHLSLLESLTSDSSIRTNRTACHEYFSGGQTCVFDGFTCLDLRPTTPGNSNAHGRIPVIFVDDHESDKKAVPHDRWCGLKHVTADPRNGGPRVWDPEPWTVAPRWSCLSAHWRSWDSLRQEVDNIHFIPEDMWIVDLDYIGGTHNNHLLKDYVWILDLILWQESLSLSNVSTPLFPSSPAHIVFPGTLRNFTTSMTKDLNKLIWALVLRLPLEPLYENFADTIKYPPGKSPFESSRLARKVSDAYPKVFESGKMMFHKDHVLKNLENVTSQPSMTNGSLQTSDTQKPVKYDLLCSPRLVAGAKLPGYGYERVCAEMRRRSWDLFGIKEGPMIRTGQLVRATAPKRIIIVNRSVTRRIMNASILHTDLQEAFAPYGVEVELTDTSKLKSAETNVRAYARAGVVITPHGSHAMSLIFMPKFTSLIEVYPAAYRHYAFKFGAESCMLFHFEVYGKPHPRLQQKTYDACMKFAGPHEISNCPYGEVKSLDIPVDSKDVIEKAFLAFAKMGYDLRKFKVS